MKLFSYSVKRSFSMVGKVHITLLKVIIRKDVEM